VRCNIHIVTFFRVRYSEKKYIIIYTLMFPSGVLQGKRYNALIINELICVWQFKTVSYIYIFNMSLKIANKLLYFSKIGDYFEVKPSEFREIWLKVRINDRKRRFKCDKIGDNYIIWRVK
jgi:hypothetical protein